MKTMLLNINNQAVNVIADPDTPLLWALRSEQRLVGAKYGCGKGLCGACTVHLDGQAVRSCSLPVSAAVGRRITTIEGIDTPEARAVKAAWRVIDVAQCGYCQSGQVMSACALLASKPAPSDADIDAAMSGNLCRCGTYPRIRAAIHLASRSL
ncbi:MAG: (2Fe-2S)-binding protein [Hydrogenophaga sp.]|uniref:(2Fe-2S)-binding protein n=1 Tax=Hydrogenophaga sp. TaxID=1904254 RepID=UPI00257F85C2|nr:2Fe-2S iron-sulfur cluster-binding protein [Hydrogenophaga sp.]MBL0943634.1 (2Fe-2S)-binding protein [Hydrogenophaga sp.]